MVTALACTTLFENLSRGGSGAVLTNSKCQNSMDGSVQSVVSNCKDLLGFRSSLVLTLNR